MMTMAFLSGTALRGIVFCLVHRYRLAGYERALTLAIPAIRLLMTITLVVAGLVVAWQILWGMYGVIPGLADANRAIFAGPLALWFWVVRVGAGLVIPLLLLLIPRTRTPEGLFATCCLVFLGIFADRAIFVSAGQIVPGTAVGGVVSDPFAEYVPTLVEAAIVLGAFGFFGLAYTLVERYAPMGEHTGHLAGAFLGSTGHPGGTREASSDLVPAPEAVGPTVAVPAPEPFLAPDPVLAPEAVPAGGPVPLVAPSVDPGGGAP
jgi:Ni/Fe-hydrogenase subunit HybB-like protein